MFSWHSPKKIRSMVASQARAGRKLIHYTLSQAQEHKLGFVLLKINSFVVLFAFLKNI